MIDAEGLDALSMRGLGAALGVEAMALYHHFASKGELLDAVAERLMLGVEAPGREAGDPFERIREGARSYRRAAIEHPHAFVLLTTRRFTTERSLAQLERILEPFFDAGLDARTAAHMFRLVGYYAGGAGHAEIASRAQQPDATPVRMESLAEPARFPLATAVAPHLRLRELDALLERGLDAIVGVIREAAARA